MKVAYRGFPSRRFGVEVEMSPSICPLAVLAAVRRVEKHRGITFTDAYAVDQGNQEWHLKKDHSCGDKHGEYGLELVSHVCGGWRDLRKVGKVVGAVRDAGAVVNRKCAVHVHVDVEDFSKDQIATLLAKWMLVEPFFFNAVPAWRTRSKHCRSLWKVHASWLDYRKAYTVGEFGEKAIPFGEEPCGPARDIMRRVSVNVMNAVFNQKHRCTVELRLPEGTIAPADVVNWIRVFVNFVDFCRSVDFPKSMMPLNLFDAMSTLGLAGDSGRFLLLGNGLRISRQWFLKRIAKLARRTKLKLESQALLAYLGVATAACVTPPKP